MPQAGVDFDAPDLAKQLERLSDSERDGLPFGVVLLDREGVIHFYNAVEREAGHPDASVGKKFFDIAKRPVKQELGDRIRHAIEEGERIDWEFGWKGSHRDPKEEMRLRVQSAANGGVWVCFERDEPAG
jgi:photoactive yellow protein